MNWCGPLHIGAPGESLVLHDIQLSGPSTCSFKPDAVLQFLSFVDTAHVPLHRVAGPSWTVHTADEDTERWMGERLLGDIEATQDGEHTKEQRLDSWERNGVIQSGAGVLVKSEGLARLPNGLNITELLFYAAASWNTKSEQSGVLTPPRSSSPYEAHNDHEDGTDLNQQVLRVFALPLSSDLRRGLATAPQTPITPLTDRGNSTAQFLEPADFTCSADENPRKRQRLDSIFSNHDRGKKRSHKAFPKAPSDATKTAAESTVEKEETEKVEMLVRKRSKSVAHRATGLARSHSIGSTRDLEDVRPHSRNGHLARMQRSSLHRVTSTSQLETSSSASNMEAGVGVDDIELKNKNALSRVIMTGMRMYGLSQQYQHKRSNSYSAGSETNAMEDVGNDEYKMVYHQTYKGAAFALRKHFSINTLGTDVLRETVDQLLAIFCSDPCQGAGFTDENFQAFDAQKSSVEESTKADSSNDNG